MPSTVVSSLVLIVHLVRINWKYNVELMKQSFISEQH